MSENEALGGDMMGNMSEKKLVRDLSDLYYDLSIGDNDTLFNERLREVLKKHGFAFNQHMICNRYFPTVRSHVKGLIDPSVSRITKTGLFQTLIFPQEDAGFFYAPYVPQYLSYVWTPVSGSDHGKINSED